ncbi:MAG: tandem-95 repeat protein, partial [Acidobacteria bacterium]|nr:tandem-95 repeat protein [Acidobacteriota bacterium]
MNLKRSSSPPSGGVPVGSRPALWVLVLLTALGSTGPVSAANQCIASQPQPQADDFLFNTLDAAMVDVLGNDGHSLGLPLTVALGSVQTPEGGTLELNPDATFTYRRAANFRGRFDFTYQVSDGHTTVHDIPVSVGLFADLTNLPASHRPSPLDDTVIVPDGSTGHAIAAADLLANDSDPDAGDTELLIIDPATLGAPLRGSLSVDQVDPATGGVVQLTYEPAADFFSAGWDTFTYEVADPSGLVATATVHLFAEGWTGPPNTPPTAVDHLFEIAQGTRTFIPWAAILDGSSDPEGDWLTVVVLTAPDPTVTRQWVVEEAGVVWQPEPTFIASTTFTYQVFDGEDLSAPATVTLDVQVNTTPPTAGYDGPFLVPKYGRLFIYFEDPGGGEPNLFGNDSSPIPNAELIPVQLAFGSPAHGRIDFCCDARGFWYIPDDGYEGTDSFWYTVAINDLSQRHATAKVRLDVQHLGGPDPPVTTAVGEFLQASPLGETAVLWSDLLANDQGTNLRFLTLIPEQVSPIVLPYGEIEVLSPGFDYGGPEAPPAGYEGALVYTNVEVPPVPELDQVDYRIYRPDDLSSGRATLFLAVDPFDNYIAYNDLVHTVEGRTTNAWFNGLLANDTLSGVSGADPTIDPTFLSQPRVGRFTHLKGVGGVSYRPPPGFVGVDSFTYRLVDRNGLAPDLVARVVVVVEEGTPVPLDDTASTFQGLAVEIDALANDTDPNGDPLHLVSVAPPPAGQAVIVGSGAGGRIVFTPDAAGSGPVSFGYTVADADGNQASATVQVDVVANEPPVAVAEVFC